MRWDPLSAELCSGGKGREAGSLVGGLSTPRASYKRGLRRSTQIWFDKCDTSQSKLGVHQDKGEYGRNANVSNQKCGAHSVKLGYISTRLVNKEQG